MAKLNFAVRDGDVSDLPSVFALANSWRGQTDKVYYQGEESRLKVDEGVRSGAKLLLIAERAGVVTGFASYKVEAVGAFVNLVLVDFGEVHTGVATALIGALQKRYSRLEAFNDVEPEMRKMYEKLGFRCTDMVEGAFRKWVWGS
jgi:hypothetical protein